MARVLKGKLLQPDDPMFNGGVQFCSVYRRPKTKPTPKPKPSAETEMDMLRAEMRAGFAAQSRGESGHDAAMAVRDEWLDELEKSE